MPTARFSQRLAALALVLLAAAPCAHAQQVVITRVWGGGLNLATAAHSDWVELLNIGSTPVNLSGWSLQTNEDDDVDAWRVAPLSGTLTPGQYYLVQPDNDNTGSNGLPFYSDAFSAGAVLSTSGGKIALVRNSLVPFTGACPLPNSDIIDFLGYGAAVNCSETAPAPAHAFMAPGSITVRTNQCVDTNSNAADFSVLAPAPHPPFNSFFNAFVTLTGNTDPSTAFPTEISAGSSVSVGVSRSPSHSCNPLTGPLTSASINTSSLIGGSASTPLTDNGGGNFSISVPIDSAQPSGTYALPLIVSDGTTSLTVHYKLRVLGAAPINDLCTNALVVTTSVTSIGASNAAATSDIDPGACNTGAAGNFGVWYNFTPAVEGTILFSENTLQDVASGIWVTAAPANPAADCPILSGLPATQFICLSAETWAAKFSPGATYYLQVGNSATTAPTRPFNAELSWIFTAPANDACAAALDITGSMWPRPFAADNRFATDDPIDTCSTGSLTIAPHSVWYRFTAPGPGSLLIDETSAQNVAIAVWDVSTIPVPGTDCPNFTGSNSLQCVTGETLTLITAAGHTYYIMLHSELPSPQAPIVPMSGTFAFTPSPAGDLCATPIPLSLNTPVNGTLANANNDYQISSFSPPFIGVGNATNTAPGRDVVYSFTPSVTGAYSVRVILGQTANLQLYITDNCVTGTSPVTLATGSPGVLAANNRNSSTTNASEELHNVALNSGTTYYIHVDQVTLNALGTFIIEVFKTSPEIEPNGTPAEANTYTFGDSGMEGSIVPAGDADFYSLGTPAAGSRVFALADGAAASVNSFEMRLTTDTATLEYDTGGADTLFGASSPIIVGRQTTGVPTFLRMSYSVAATQSEPYRLYAVVQPPSSSAAAETEPNNAIAQANSHSSNYFAANMSSSSDIDIFSFTAAAGQLIFMAVDNNPARAVTTTQNCALAILDSTGTVIISVNDTGTTANNTAGATLTSTTPTSTGDALVWRAQTSGTYYARVTTATAAGGDYLLSIASFPDAPSTELCCRGTTCVSVASGTCTGTVGNSASLVVGACGPNNQIAHCCYADYDHSGTSTIDDLFIYINTWLVASPYTRIDGDTLAAPSIDDLFIFINFWLAGCS